MHDYFASYTNVSINWSHPAEMLPKVFKNIFLQILRNKSVLGCTFTSRCYKNPHKYLDLHLMRKM